MDLVQKGFIKAYELHKDQKRKANGAPYFVHLVDTAKYLMYETDDDEVITAGLLHDSLEDTDYYEAELKNDFGERVFSLVKFCTEPKREDKKKSWKERKTHTINKISLGNEDELIILCADKVSTLYSIREDLVNGIVVWDYLNCSKEDSLWYYSKLEEELGKKISDKRIYKIFKNILENIKNF